jgi:hypothetical protein
MRMRCGPVRSEMSTCAEHHRCEHHFSYLTHVLAIDKPKSQTCVAVVSGPKTSTSAEHRRCEHHIYYLTHVLAINRPKSETNRRRNACTCSGRLATFWFLFGCLNNRPAPVCIVGFWSDVQAKSQTCGFRAKLRVPGLCPSTLSSLC